MTTRSALVVSLLLLGCGLPGIGERPDVPTTADERYVVGGLGNWYVIGNEVTAGQDRIEFTVTAPTGTDFVDLWLADQMGLRLDDVGGGSFSASLDIAGLPPGEYSLVLSANGSDTGFGEFTIRRSHPLYAVVTTDWDDADNSQLNLDLQQQLHDEHPELKLTHLVGPYTFTDPALTESRREQLAQWTRDMRDTYDDEIGLHIHPYCNFVESAGVTCRTEPSTVYSAGDSSGYTVMCSAYTEGEFTQLLEHADDLFAQYGLGKPTSFRAGGWTADLTVMRALANAGYVADTSANNWARMEEWEGSWNGVLYEWNKEHWSSIGDTSQPYYPSKDDVLITGPQTVPVLQVPDNGILVDYVTTQEMIDIFNANWDGTPLAEPVAYSIGYHPPNFDANYKARMTEIMSHLDQYLASNHAGPVVYETLSNMALVWKH